MYPLCLCGHRYDHHRHHVPEKCYQCTQCCGYDPDEFALNRQNNKQGQDKVSTKVPPRALSVVLAFLFLFLFSIPQRAQTIKIRDLPTNPAPSLSDLFVAANVAGTATYKATPGAYMSLRTISCTPPLLCGGSTSHTLGSDFVLALSGAYIDFAKTSFEAVVLPITDHGKLFYDDGLGLAFMHDDGSVTSVENQANGIDVTLSAGGAGTFTRINPGSGVTTTDLGGGVVSISSSGGSGSGTVTSVTGPGELSWATATTTPTATWANQTQGKVLASPPTSTGTPTFRPIAKTDIPAMADVIIDQTSNGDIAITSSRATDSSPTGAFEVYKSAAGSSLWKVDILGSLAAGSVPEARIVGPVTVGRGGTGTASTLTGLVRGNASAMTAAELSGDVSTSGSNVVAVSRINGTFLAGLATGILKNTNSTGQPSIAVAADFPVLNQNTTGTAAGLSATNDVPHGGTGGTTLPAHGVLVGNGASAVNVTVTGNGNQVLTGNGPFSDPSFQDPKTSLLPKVSDQTAFNSTLTSDSDLSGTLVPGTYRYEFDVHILDNSAGASGGFKAALEGTAITTLLIGQAELWVNSSQSIVDMQRFTAVNQTVGIVNADFVLYLKIAGMVVVSTTGTFGLKWSQMSTAAGGVTVKAGSTLAFQKQ